MMLCVCVYVLQYNILDTLGFVYSYSLLVLFFRTYTHTSPPPQYEMPVKSKKMRDVAKPFLFAFPNYINVNMVAMRMGSVCVPDLPSIIIGMVLGWGWFRGGVIVFFLEDA